MTDQPTPELDPSSSDKGAVRGRLPRIVGRLVELGDMTDSNGDPVSGLLIECDRSDLLDCGLNVYRQVEIVAICWQCGGIGYYSTETMARYGDDPIPCPACAANSNIKEP